MNNNIPSESLSHQIGEVLQQAVEAIFFATSDPLSFETLSQVMKDIYDVPLPWIQKAFDSYKQSLDSTNRGIEMIEVGGGFLLRTRPHLQPLIQRLHLGRTREKLSSTQMETLACIAFRQPITKPEIEAIRGVDTTAAIHNLLERKLIEPAGRKNVLGRPVMYQTTPFFLKHFGLKNIDQIRTQSANGSSVS